MIVLGISETHCATAAVLRDGAIVGCASEERFSRLRNDAGYPRLAIDALLRELTLAPSAIDRVVLAGTRIPSYDWMNRVMRDPEYVRQYYAVRLDAPRRGLGGRARKLGAKVGLLDPAPGKSLLPERERRAAVTTHLGIDGERVSIVDHHTCHAAAAYFGSPFAGAPALVLTNDNSGDGLCATASSAHGTLLERREATPSGPGSLGSFYTLVTLLLGMKPGEHEYKVMGLAPYATAGPTARATAALRTVFDFVEAQPCRFEWKKRGPLYRAVLEATLGMRFDWIAGGAQRILEESLLGWARLMRERHGGERLALGGRSILANPSDHRVVPLINRMIKNRDFWMPFAPSVLREREADYLVNPKGLASPYMMLAFPTNPKRRDEIVAAIHPHDSTARAHIVDEAWNPPYYRVLREFEARTGIGAVLNTSFNLHGEPLVASPEDAVDTFERSGLPHLALGRYLISKRTP